MTSLAYRFAGFVFTLAFAFAAFHLFVHPWLTAQMNGAINQIPSQYSGILTSPTHAI